MATSFHPALAIREYFLLSEARATSERLPEPRRAAVADTLSLARQRADAADALWTLGHTAEGLRLAVQAFDATLAAADELAVGLGLAAGLPAGVDRAAPVTAPEPATEAAAESAFEPVQSGSDSDTESDSDSDAESDSESDSASDSESESESESESNTESETASATGSEFASATESESATDTATDTASESDTASGSATEAGTAPRVVVRPVGVPTAGGPWSRSLAARGLAESKLRDLEVLVGSLRRDELPALDDEVSPAHAEVFRDLLRTRRAAERALAPAALTGGQILRTRTVRWIGGAIAALAVLVGLYMLVRTPTEATATASAVYGNRPDFQPDKVVDGDTETEWLLPDATAGHVEVHLSPPRNLSALRIRNAHNRNILDRGTKDYTVEVLSGGEVVHTQGGQWSRIEPNPQWTEFDVDLQNVDTIRVQVRTWHREGGGIAEIDWDE